MKKLLFYIIAALIIGCGDLVEFNVESPSANQQAINYIITDCYLDSGDSYTILLTIELNDGEEYLIIEINNNYGDVLLQKIVGMEIQCEIER